MFYQTACVLLACKIDLGVSYIFSNITDHVSGYCTTVALVANLSLHNCQTERCWCRAVTYFEVH